MLSSARRAVFRYRPQSTRSRGPFSAGINAGEISVSDGMFGWPMRTEDGEWLLADENMIGRRVQVVGLEEVRQGGMLAGLPATAHGGCGLEGRLR